MPLKYERPEIERLLSYYLPDQILPDLAYWDDLGPRSLLILSDEDERIRVAHGMFPEIYIAQFIVQTGELFWLMSGTSKEKLPVLSKMSLSCCQPALVPDVLMCSMRIVQNAQGGHEFVAMVNEKEGAGSLLARAVFSFSSISRKAVVPMVAAHNGATNQKNGAS